MAKMIVITERKMNHVTGRYEEIASHGECLRTGRRVEIDAVSPESLGASFDADAGEWMLDHDRPALRLHA